MTSVMRYVTIRASADNVGKVIREFETGPSRMAPGHVVDTRTDAA